MSDSEIARLQRENEELRREREKERREREAAEAREERERREKERERREKEAAEAREERERREKERERREKERERREKERERREKAQLVRENQPTTLDEYLWNCHTYLYQNFKLADKSISSTGSTSVDGKFYPMWIRPWTKFADSLRQQQFDVIRGACGKERLFNQRSTTRDIGRNISAKLASNESAVTYFEKIATEDAIIAIFKHLEGQEAMRAKYGFSELRFSDNGREITQASAGSQPANEGDPSEDRLERRLQTGPNKRVASEQRVKPRPANPDGFGLRTRLSGDKSMAFVYDYKAAHKVAAEHVKLAVAKETLFMEVIEQLNSNKSRIGAELEQFRAEARIAMALTQVFDYMVNYGVAYGYIAAGQSLLLVHFDPAHPQTLYCHPCVPDEDVGETSAANWADKMIYTAVAQLSSLVLLSLGSNALQGAILDASLESANAALARWPEPYEDAAHFLSEEDTESSLAQSSSPLQEDGFTSSAAPTGRVVSLRTRSSSGISALRRRDHDSDEEEEPEGRLPSTRTTSDVAKRKVGPSDSSSEEDAEMPGSAPTRQYCSQACLLGLKKGRDLDNGCPNVLSHRMASEASTRHLINADEFTHLVSLQLCKDPYRNCYALDGWGKKGAIGVLFRLELEPYGYTFVGKGTWSNRLERLRHECSVYERLESLQGWVVPVQLGLVHLGRGYVLPGGTRAVHMMLMSWGGEEAAKADMGAADLRAQWHRSSAAVWAHGVEHGDERHANLLWNAERRRVMIIDFDRAVLRPPLKHCQLSAVSGTKRQHGVDNLKIHSQKRRKRSLPLNRSQFAYLMSR